MAERNVHGGKLCVGIISRSDLDNISADEVEAIETTDDSPDLTGTPASSLRGTGSGGDCERSMLDNDLLQSDPCVSVLTGRVNGVDIDGEIDRILSANSVTDLLDNAVDTCGMIS